VIYREGIRGSAGPLESRSPNRHNRLKLSVEPLEPDLIDMILKGKVYDGMDQSLRTQILRDLGWRTNEARGIWTISEKANIFTNVTRGVQRLDQIKGSITIRICRCYGDGSISG